MVVPNYGPEPHLILMIRLLERSRTVDAIEGRFFGSNDHRLPKKR